MNLVNLPTSNMETKEIEETNSEEDREPLRLDSSTKETLDTKRIGGTTISQAVVTYQDRATSVGVHLAESQVTDLEATIIVIEVFLI